MEILEKALVIGAGTGALAAIVCAPAIYHMTRTNIEHFRAARYLEEKDDSFLPSAMQALQTHKAGLFWGYKTNYEAWMQWFEKKHSN